VKKTLDTNVLVRALVHDESRQSAIAVALLDDGLVHVPLTVAIETEWVLRSHFKLDKKTVNSLMISYLSRDNVEVEQREAVENAVLAHKDGWDFADALHVQSAQRGGEFLTFDRKLARFAAKHRSPVPLRVPR
jgi:predicted nucleic-acid-binding protein